MDDIIDIEILQTYAQEALAWFEQEVFTYGALWELGTIAATFFVARLFSKPFEKFLDHLIERSRFDVKLARVWRTFVPLVTPIIWVILLWVAVAAADQLVFRDKLMSVVVSLVNAWIVIRLITQFVRDEVWARFIAVVVWGVAALNILELLQPTLNLLDSIALKIGEIRVSVLAVLEGIFYLVLLLWLANLVARILESRISQLPNLTPSVQVLFSKLLKIALIFIAILVAINSVGIDLTAFAVFGGALGVGIGFGLQKIISNFVSGIILLMDSSIKPGDTIGVAGTYGWIQSLGARYVSVITPDGIEHLIPNEDLIVNQVENWSFSGKRVRLKVPVGISYNSDVRKAMALCVESTESPERILDTPKPTCQLLEFGDNSVNLEIRFWIGDPQNGTANVKTAVLLGVWDRFHEHGIDIPFPQRDLHIRSVVPEARGLFEGMEVIAENASVPDETQKK
ncbi:MAG: mechanosensitive ion channel [Alphaproteobacteria bacterium]|jgi:small-conductance mechanosensitive channel|nr:mechanosensitive ion channel [Alphaproteobacteria bacterium]